MFSFLGSGNFLFRYFLWIFGEGMIQNNNVIAIKKTEYPENIVAMLHPDFPYVICILQFYEKLMRNNVNLFNEIENKRNFLKLFIGERIEIFLH